MLLFASCTEKEDDNCESREKAWVKVVSAPTTGVVNQNVKFDLILRLTNRFTDIAIVLLILAISVRVSVNVGCGVVTQFISLLSLKFVLSKKKKRKMLHNHGSLYI